jgi:hypothetical protein
MRKAELSELAKTKDDPSVRNMATAIMKIHDYFNDSSKKIDLIDFVTYLSNNVLCVPSAGVREIILPG